MVCCINHMIIVRSLCTLEGSVLYVFSSQISYVYLKAENYPYFFPAPIKGRAQFYTSSHSNSTNTCEVTMQVKRAIGKSTVHKLPIYNEYMCLCWVSTLFCMICCVFSNCSKSYTTRSLCIQSSCFHMTTLIY